MLCRYRKKGTKQYTYGHKVYKFFFDEWTPVNDIRLFKALQSYPDIFDTLHFFDLNLFLPIADKITFKKDLIITRSKTIADKLEGMPYVRKQAYKPGIGEWIFKILNYSTDDLTAYQNTGKIVNILAHRDLGGIGDIIMTTSVIEKAVKEYPNYKMTYACPEEFLPLLENNPFITDLKPIRSDVTKKDWDAVIDLTSDCIKHEMKNQPNVKLNRAEIFAQKCGFPIDNVPRPKIYLSENEILKAKGELKDFKLKIGLVLKSNASVRNWPYFKELRTALSKKYPQATILEFSIKRPPYWKFIKKSYPVFERNLREVSALINECDVVISPDTGLAHIASALRVPTVWIFTHIDGKIRTKNYDNVWICQDVPKNCASKGIPCWYDIPCSQGEIERKKNPLCSLAVKPEYVMSKVDEILSRPNISYCLWNDNIITEKRIKNIFKHKKYNDEIVLLDNKICPKGRYKAFFHNILLERMPLNITNAERITKGCSISKENNIKKKKNKNKVSLIIPVYNNCGYTKKCIQSILNNFHCNYEIIVVDNGSFDNTPNLAKEFSIKYIRYDRPLGFSLPNNIGVEQAIGDYLLFLNNDTEVSGDVFLSLFEGFSDKNVGAVGCHGARITENEKGVFCHVGQIKDVKGEKTYLEGWCLLISKDIFEKVGGFTEGYKIALSEDADLSFKLRHFGYKLKVVDNVKIKHFGSLTLKNQSFFDVGKVTSSNNIILTEKWKNKKIILQRKGAIGDVLMTTPIIRKLKEIYPDHKLIFNTIKECSRVLENNPFIDELNYESNVKGAIALDYECFPEENRLKVMARQAGIKLNSYKPEIYFTNEELNYQKKFFERLPKRRYVAFHTGRSWKNREINIEKWKVVAKWLGIKGYSIVQFGDSQTEMMENVGHDLTALFVRQTAVLLKGCDFFVGIDSAIAHFAKAADIPQVIVYGCTDPKVLRNSDKEYSVWMSDLECAGCQQRKPSATYVECERNKIYCVDLITPEMIIKTIKEMLFERAQK
jgi:ADP-heptose:LPS heptosyltransferase